MAQGRLTGLDSLSLETGAFLPVFLSPGPIFMPNLRSLFLPAPLVPVLRPLAIIGLLLSCGTSLLSADKVAVPVGSGRLPWSDSRLRGTPTPPEPYQIELAFPHVRFDHPVSLLEVPGQPLMLIAEMGGRVLTLAREPDASETMLVLDLAATAGGKVSVFGAVLHPQFEQNGFLYVCYVHPGEEPRSRVSRFTLKPGKSLTADSASETVIISWPSGGHNAGCLRFGKDGLLYIATGDGSGPNPPDGLTTGQDVTDLLGAILRVNVDSPADGRHYSVPADNPFVGQPAARPEIFAYGLRNPWRFGIDQESNEVFVADNGWETWEMIHQVKAGTNCGWPIMEGRVKLRSEVAPGPTPVVPPIRDHHHSEANSVIGGPVYRGSQLPQLNGQFVYGDYITGTIWSVGRTAAGTFEGQTLVDTDLRIIDFTQGRNGELFVLDYDLSGQIYRLVPNSAPDLSREFPRLLSETGLFSRTATLEPAAGVVRYDVIAPRWTDGATSARFVAVPGTQSIRPAAHSAEPGEYPPGTVLVKHLSVPESGAGSQAGKPLETQILLFDQGVWNPYSYLWNEEGTDAALVPPTGATRTVSWPDADSPDGFQERTWRVSAINECRLCHNAGPGYVLGFVGNQLDRYFERNGRKVSQLQRLLRTGILSAVPDMEKHTAWKLVSPADASHSLEDRARSWLHGNCSMCHHRGGNAIVSFFATKNLSFDEMGTNKGTGIGTFGMQNAKVIAAGDPLRSVMMYRISKLGYARMPYIGSQVVDSQGVALIEEWIRSRPKEPARELSPPLVAGTPESKALKSLHDEAASAEARTESIRLLTSSTEGALALAGQLHSGLLPAADRQRATEVVRNAGSDIRGLFDHFVPEASRKKTLGRTFDPQLVLSGKGDVQRGRLIFFSDAARCRTCHHTDDAGLSVGPTLTEISRKYSSNSELLDHIVRPSLKVEEKFAAWTAVLKSGQVVNGLKSSDTDTDVTLRTAEGKSVSVPKADIEELQSSTRSLMPEGILADLTAEEATDLMSFIQSLRP